MKTIYVLFLTLAFQVLGAQTYIPDATFGNNGIIKNNMTLAPRQGLLIDGYYYLLSGNTLTCLNYSGEQVTGFGTDGTLSIYMGAASYETLSWSGMLYHDGFIYIYGNLTNNNYNTADMIIFKMSPNGVPDSTFGVAGAVKIDLGLRDTLCNFVFEPDGGLFCAANLTNPQVYSESRMIYFKLLPNGLVNYSFDATGYKIINIGNYNFAGGIVAYGSEYLLVGSVNALNDTLGYKDMYITKIDAAGTIDTTYGTNGFIRSRLAEGVGSNSISAVKLYDDKLFVQHFYAFSFLNQGYYLQGFDLIANQKLYDYSMGSAAYLDQVADNIYSTSYLPYTGGLQNYQLNNKFNIERRKLNGELDLSFDDDATYNYTFPYEVTPVGSTGSSASYCFIAEPDGKFAILGRIYEMFNSYFGMMRITPNTLTTQQPNDSDRALAVYPNPFDNEIALAYKGNVTSVSVCDLLGREIRIGQWEKRGDGTYTVDLSALKQPGAYLLKVSGDGGQSVQKIVKR